MPRCMEGTWPLPRRSLSMHVDTFTARACMVQVRDALNLTYDVTMELAVFSLLHAGWWTINVTSRPASISDAVTASMRVLRNVASSRIRHSELERAKRAVLTRLDTDCKVHRTCLACICTLAGSSCRVCGRLLKHALALRPAMSMRF